MTPDEGMVDAGRVVTMKPTTLSAILLASMMSVVAAAPVDNETTERVSYTGKVAKARHDATDGGWVELAAATPASHGREFIPVEATRYVRLRIEAVKGRPIIQMLRLTYASGKREVIRVDALLGTRRTPSAFVELRGSDELEMIVVLTDRDSSGTYAVYGELPRTGGVARGGTR